MTPGSAFANPDDAEIADHLRRVRTIAVVGLSPNPRRPSYGVARGLQAEGFRIVPVRPSVDSVLGEKAWARLEDVPFPVDLVDVFRAPEHVATIVESCIALRAAASPGGPHPWFLWLQLGVIHPAAAERARDHGMAVVMNRCLLVDYRKGLGSSR